MNISNVTVVVAVLLAISFAWKIGVVYGVRKAVFKTSGALIDDDLKSQMPSSVLSIEAFFMLFCSVAGVAALQEFIASDNKNALILGCIGGFFIFVSFITPMTDPIERIIQKSADMILMSKNKKVRGRVTAVNENMVDPSRAEGLVRYEMRLADSSIFAFERVINSKSWDRIKVGDYLAIFYFDSGDSNGNTVNMMKMAVRVKPEVTKASPASAETAGA